MKDYNYTANKLGIDKVTQAETEDMLASLEMSDVVSKNKRKFNLKCLLSDLE